MVTSADRVQGPVTAGVVGCGPIARKHHVAGKHFAAPAPARGGPELMGATPARAIRKVRGRVWSGHETLIRAGDANLRRGQAPPVDGAQGRLVVALLDGISAALAAAAPGRG